MKNYLSVLFIILVAMCTTTCQDKPLGPGDVNGITLNKESLTLSVGKTETLTATVIPPTAKNKTVIWSSSNEAVVTVHHSSGEVTATGVGSATITATTHNGKTEVCYVTVNPIPVISVEIIPNTLTLNTNTPETLMGVIKPEGTTQPLMWKSNNPGVITVDENGKIRSTDKEGTATITATADGGITGTCIVTVAVNTPFILQHVNVQ